MSTILVLASCFVVAQGVAWLFSFGGFSLTKKPVDTYSEMEQRERYAAVVQFSEAVSKKRVS